MVDCLQSLLDSREGARNSRAKAENWSGTEGTWEEASPQSLLVFFSSLAVHSRLTRSRDYLERDCEPSTRMVLRRARVRFRRLKCEKKNKTQTNLPVCSDVNKRHLPSS